MNRIFASLCLLVAACGEVSDINPSNGDGGLDVDASTGGLDAAPGDPCAGPSIALEDFRSCFLEMQCELLVRCLPGFPDEEFCKTRAFDYQASMTGNNKEEGPPTRLMFDIIARADAAGVADFDGEKAYSCLSSIAGKACKDKVNSADCEYFLTGTVAENGACSDDFECREGAFCNRESGATCSDLGFCESRLGVGEGCGSASCRSELDCVSPGGSDAPPTCQDGSLGSDCFNSSNCNSELYCNANFLCVADKSAGAACASGAECPGNESCIGGSCSSVDTAGDECEDHCDGNLYCSATSQCQAMPGPGGECSAVPSTGLGRCNSVDLACGPLGSCSPRLQSGSSCRGPLAQSCALGTFCNSEIGVVASTCVPPQAQGAICYETKHCASEYCERVGNNSSCQVYEACWE